MSTDNVRSHATTVMLSSSQISAVPDHVTPSPGRIAQEVEYLHAGRLFVGPMPMKVAAPIVAEKDKRGRANHWWLTLHDRGHDDQDDGDDDENEVPERHALRFFLQLGGHEEDWDAQEGLRKRTKREMLRRWRQSGWGFLSHHRNKARYQTQKWVGQTFQIGTDFLGVPMQTAGDAKPSKIRSSNSSKSLEPPDSPEASTSKTFPAATSQIAPTGRSESHAEDSSTRSSSADHNNRESRVTNGSGVALLPKGEPSKRRQSISLPRLLSMTSMASKAMTDVQIRNKKVLSDNGDPSLTTTSDLDTSGARTSIPRRSALRRLQSRDPRGKSVQFSPVVQEPAPVPPSEVLARHPSTNPDTSDGAAAQTQIQEVSGQISQYGDVFLSDRMVVRRFYVKSGNTGTYFDAEQAVKVRDLRAYEWKELLVVWRKGQLELYEDYSIPCKEAVLGHKHLAFVIPLQKPDTKLSLYSFTDLTFCLTCPMIHVAKDLTRTASGLSAMVNFNRGSRTEIFVFKGKSRSRSVDWMWNIWRWLGNDIPRSIDVYCPATENRVRLQVPDFDQAGGEGYKKFTRDHVVKMCRSAQKHLPSWDYLIEEPLSRGARLELCWRKEAMLDWIYWDKDADGHPRDWGVLYGLSLGKPQEITHLEARIAEHRPTSVTLSDGKHFREPPAMEGYLYRIRPLSQIRSQVYISTHGGFLFFTNASRAQPPHPPIPINDEVVDAKDTSLTFQESEVRRETVQVLQADNLIDLRNVVAVRRAFQVQAPLQDSRDTHTIDPRGQADISQTVEDNDDRGGDEVLSIHHDKPNLKMRRSFELLMETGEVVRFEAYSCSVALEWITRLSHLVEYWKHRHRLDAREEMDMIHAVTGNSSAVLANPEKVPFPEHPPDYDQSSEYLPSFWNWCVLDGCLSVIKNGRLYLRRGFRSQYRLTQLVLVSGHLIQFHIIHGTVHHLRSKTTSLLDAYVCSGHFAVQELPADEFSVTSDPLPRRFQDGLENDDPEFDKILLIWYRPHAIGKVNARRDPSRDLSETAVPPLNSKRKLVVLKARSRLERNSWCWALNAEIERISRSGDRDARARNADLKLAKK